MNIEHFEADPEMHPVIAEVIAPREEPDHSGESLRVDGEGIGEVIRREFSVDPGDSLAVMAAIRNEKDLRRKAQLANLWREWDGEKRK